MFEIEKSLKSVGNFLYTFNKKLFSSKSVGSMLPTVYTFGQKIIQLALLISNLRWTVFQCDCYNIIISNGRPLPLLGVLSIVVQETMVTAVIIV